MSAFPESLPLPMDKPYRCTKGHTWKANCMWGGIHIRLPGEAQGVSYCLYCLKEWADANLGSVTEDK